jgi:hypothetical protein
MHRTTEKLAKFEKSWARGAFDSEDEILKAKNILRGDGEG